MLTGESIPQIKKAVEHDVSGDSGHRSQKDIEDPNNNTKGSSTTSLTTQNVHYIRKYNSGGRETSHLQQQQ